VQLAAESRSFLRSTPTSNQVSSHHRAAVMPAGPTADDDHRLPISRLPYADKTMFSLRFFVNSSAVFCQKQVVATCLRKSHAYRNPCCGRYFTGFSPGLTLRLRIFSAGTCIANCKSVAVALSAFGVPLLQPKRIPNPRLSSTKYEIRN
jgi:hypothetical protein